MLAEPMREGGNYQAIREKMLVMYVMKRYLHSQALRGLSTDARSNVKD